MNELATRAPLPTMWFRNTMGLTRLNKYGAIAWEPRSAATQTIDGSTQLFESGELWGLHQRLLTIGEEHRQIGMKGVENVFRYTLTAYVHFLRHALKQEPPYNLEVGAVGIRNYRIIADPGGYDSYGPIQDDEFSFRREVHSVSEDALNGMLGELFNEFFEVTGYRRPTVYD
jgi:hypothetical protein